MSSALEKAVAILETVVESPRSLRLSELAKETGLSRQAAHRVIRQLEDCGLLGHEPLHESYIVGTRLKRLSIDALGAAQRSGTTRELLTDLVARLGESCNVGVLEGREVIYLDRVECDWPLRLQLHPGSRLPAHCTAIGKLLLAFLETDTRRRLLASAPLPSYTPRTLTDPDRLEADLEKVRRDGFSLNDQEYLLGLIGIAVPVRREDGTVFAGLAVQAPTARMDEADARAHLKDLRATAKRLGEAMSAEFGGR